MGHTSRIEREGENHVAAMLARHGIVVAKPMADEYGGDLLVLLRVEDGARILRVQCKARTLGPTSRAKITIPTAYVSRTFVVLVYARARDAGEPTVLGFLGDELNDWPESRKPGNRVLSFRLADLGDRLRAFSFTRERADRLKALINDADQQSAFDALLSRHVPKTRVANDSRVLFDDGTTIVTATENMGQWLVKEFNRLTGVTMARPSLPFHPDDGVYDPATQTLRAR